MDLSFARIQTGHAVVLPIELAVLLVGVASRQAASPTARAQAGRAATLRRACLLSPPAGAFSAATAAMLRQWKGG